jgi:hypothetical protein
MQVMETRKRVLLAEDTSSKGYKHDGKNHQSVDGSASYPFREVVKWLRARELKSCDRRVGVVRLSNDSRGRLILSKLDSRQ